MSSTKKEDWITLRSMRAEITSALEALGIPIVAWCNDYPEFKVGYKPDWSEIEQIARNVEKKGRVEWPGPLKTKEDAPEKKAAKRGPKKGRR